MDFKNTLRKEIEKKLRAISSKEITLLSQKIESNLTSSNLWDKSNEIFLYINFKKEVITKGLIEKGKRDNKKIYAPLISNNTMSFHRIDNIDSKELVKNRFGILEPSGKIPEKTPTKSSLMIVPGVAFSTNGERLGRGGGFYDRYLSQYSDIIKVAVAFDIQICKSIPTEKWDKKMNYLVTESRIYNTGDNL